MFTTLTSKHATEELWQSYGDVIFYDIFTLNEVFLILLYYHARFASETNIPGTTSNHNFLQYPFTETDFPLVKQTYQITKVMESHKTFLKKF